MTLEAFYARARRSRSQGIAAHLTRLRALAEGLGLAVEFGVRGGASSSALLLGAARVLSFDIAATPAARMLERLAGARWDYRIADSRTATIPACDLLFIDSRHTRAQCEAELAAHADRVRRYLAFHDSVTYGAIGEDGGPGIMPAIAAWQRRDPRWRTRAHYRDSHGLLILERAA